MRQRDNATMRQRDIATMRQRDSATTRQSDNATMFSHLCYAFSVNVTREYFLSRIQLSS